MFGWTKKNPKPSGSQGPISNSAPQVMATPPAESGPGLKDPKTLIQAAQSGVSFTEILSQASAADLIYEDNEKHTTPLIAAADAGRNEAVKMLIRRRAPVDQKESYGGISPIIAATKKGHYDVVVTLLDANADVNARVQGLETPLIYAAWGERLQIVELLLNRGADINMRNDIKFSALSYAARFGKCASVRLLLERGADANLGTFQGYSALTWAALEGNKDVVDILIQSGKADVNIKGNDGKSAIDVAKTEEIKDLLRRAGARESAANGTPLPIPAAASKPPPSAASAPPLLPVPPAAAMPASPPAPPVPPFPTEEDPVLPAADARLLGFQTRLAQLTQQVVDAPPRAALWQRQDALGAEMLAVLSAAPEKFSTLPALAASLSAMDGESAHLRLSAEDYLTLRERHAQLVLEMTEACRELKQNKQHAQLIPCGAVLASCKALDLSGVPEFPLRKSAVSTAAPLGGFSRTLSALLEEKRVITAQLQGVRPCRALSQRREDLQERYDAADAAEDFEQLGTLGLLLDAVALESAQLLVTEADCAGLADKHAVLLQQLRALAQAVLAVATSEGAEYEVLQEVCAALAEAQAMDLSVLSAAGDATAAGVATAEIDGDGACDPVYVPNRAVEGEVLRS